LIVYFVVVVNKIDMQHFTERRKFIASSGNNISFKPNCVARGVSRFIKVKMNLFAIS